MGSSSSKSILFRITGKHFVLICLLAFTLFYSVMWPWHSTISDFADSVYSIGSNAYFNRQQRLHQNFYFNQDTANDKRVILLWTQFNFYTMEELREIIFSGKVYDPDCCADVEITRDRNLLDSATAIIIHTRDLGSKPNVPTRRKSEQLWVLLGVESPVHTPNLTRFNDLFNLTMTYRRDSDVWAPYGETVTRNISDDLDIYTESGLDDWISKKSKIFAAAISNCRANSKRQKLLEALKNISFPVDIYGACGQKICGRWDKSCNDTTFWIQLAGEYKFYYAAENSLCAEYVTEKFWRSLELGLVPVVYGGTNYTKLAPPHSFIDVRDFSSPGHLARYLWVVAENPMLYKEFFQWRRQYKIRVYDKNLAAICKLCRLLVERKGLVKTIHNLDHWWRHVNNGTDETDACSKPLF